MDTYLQLLRDTPLPTILVIGGIVFLLLSVLQKAGTSVETKPGKERFAIITGFVLLLSGVSLYLIPPTAPVATPISSIVPTETLLPSNLPATQSKDISTATSIPVNTITPISTSAPSNLHICGDSAFNGGLQTSDPLFFRPEGYFSGWISSDPAMVILPNGATKTFETQFVLVVDNLSSVQLKGVMRQAGKANTWGCWYSADLSTFATDDAKQDFCIKKTNGFNAAFYTVNETGFQEIGTTATISCP